LSTFKCEWVEMRGDCSFYWYRVMFDHHCLNLLFIIVLLHIPYLILTFYVFCTFFDANCFPSKREKWYPVLATKVLLPRQWWPKLNFCYPIKTLELFWLSFFFTLSLTDDSYFRNVTCALRPSMCYWYS
jgi:hypothetical protein